MAVNAATSTRARSAGLFGLRSQNIGDLARKTLVYGLLIVLSLVFLFPLFWMITSALKADTEIFLWPPQWIPNPMLFSNFAKAFSNPQLPFDKFVVNALIIEAGVEVGRLISCTLVSYGFARLKAPGK